MASTDSEKDEEKSTRDDEGAADDESSTAASERDESHDEQSDGGGSDDEGSDGDESDDDADDDESDEDESGDDADEDESGGDADEGESGDDADEDESGDDESDEDGSDDEESDEEESASDDASETASAGGAADEARPAGKKKAAGKGKGRKRKQDGMTAGARLAAAKAAKAARKAAKRGKEKKGQDPIAQVRETKLVQKAEQAGSWAAQNRTLVIAAAVALLVAAGAWLGWSQYRDQQAQAAAALLEDALEIASAQIVAEDDGAGEERDPDDPPTFASEDARAEAALQAHRAVLTQYPSSTAAIWARLGEANALLELGRHEEARESFERAMNEGGSDSTVAWRALEGKAFTYEAAEQWDQALEVYQELSRIDDGRYEQVAKYHMARMYLAQGERDRATETLRGVVDQLVRADDDEDAQDFAYVLAQAQVRLHQLDPSTAPPPSSPSPFGAGGLGDTLTPEQLEQLRRMLQQQGGGGMP